MPMAVSVQMMVTSGYMLVEGRQLIKMSDKVQCEPAHLKRRDGQIKDTIYLAVSRKM